MLMLRRVILAVCFSFAGSSAFARKSNRRNLQSVNEIPSFSPPQPPCRTVVGRPCEVGGIGGGRRSVGGDPVEVDYIYDEVMASTSYWPNPGEYYDTGQMDGSLPVQGQEVNGHSQDLSQGAVGAIVAGAVLLVILLGVAVIFLVRRRRARHAAVKQPTHPGRLSLLDSVVVMPNHENQGGSFEKTNRKQGTVAI